jgi:phosphomannomutase
MLDLERQLAWTPNGVSPATELAPSNVVIFELEGGHQAMLRPSGTEPKLKFYFYVVAPLDETNDLDAAEDAARTILDEMAADLTEASGC